MAEQPDSPASELIVVARPEAGMRVEAEGLSAKEADVARLTGVLEAANARIRPLFGTSPERLRAEASPLTAAPEVQAPDLSVYYRVEAAEEQLQALARRLAEHDAVDTAYVKPPVEPAVAAAEINRMEATPEMPPPRTPDFTARQGYLDAAPGGIDARFAWTQPGGQGAEVRVIDIEGAWRFTHEDLLQNQGGAISGTQSTALVWRNHGTAVIGEFGGDRSTFGVTGICPLANVRAISVFETGSAAAIRQAANALRPGDIILIELHRPGPRFDFQARSDQRGYIAIEWWPDDFDAILYATERGVIVVEAAGNGGEDLDDPVYDTPGTAAFPAGWADPFNRGDRDCGAILVGAGAPPPGTHGRSHWPDRSRLDFSNFGAAVDAQGWGSEVTTTGYGDLQGGPNEDEWYTDEFGGTSSASPIVVGAVGSLQGVRHARGAPALTPPQARQLLRTTGSPQQDAPGRRATQRIGSRPDLARLIAALDDYQVEWPR
jgi:subtilisin family serine protease